MKTKMPKSILAKHKDKTKKDIRFLSIFFLSINAFLTFMNSQCSSIVPVWLWYSSVLVSVISCAMLIYGFWLSVKYKSKYQSGYFIAMSFCICSIHLFLTSNILYLTGRNAGRILEQIDYFKFSLIVYLAMGIIASIFIYIISSPKLLFKRIKSFKIHLLSIIGGIVLVGITIVLMKVTLWYVFVQPEAMNDSYDILIGSILSGFSAVSIIIMTWRVKNNLDK